MKKLTTVAIALTLAAGAVFWAFTDGLLAVGDPTVAIAGEQRLALIRTSTASESRHTPVAQRLFGVSTGVLPSSQSAEHPRASFAIAPERELSVAGSSFAVRGSGGNFAPVAPPLAGSPPAISGWGQNRLPELIFTPTPAQLEFVLTDTAERKTHRLTLEQAQAFVLQPNTLYDVRVLARYNGARYTGTVNFGYTITTNALAVDFMISGDTTDLGEALVLRVRNLPNGAQVTVETSLPDNPVFFLDGQGGAVALLPVSIHTTTGEHFVELKAAGTSARFPVRVLATEFVVQRFDIDQSTANRTVNSAAANAQYREMIHPLRLVSDPVRHWQGRFGYPVTPGEGRITTPFAVIRFVNGVGPSRHAAIDIALPQGTPVYAPASGRVLFAGYLQLTGNTIAIEHGLGLKTWYYHLVSLDVQTGDMVERDQRIGAVGTTGFSTGPHLHYGMSVFGVFINPDTATNTDIFNWS
ncbi:MAG: M23 family metallopeptidase [Oscillospiraceae bacterium]|nr:M23 family metallopeptidase [Oscillospiraceae bacterium]